MEKCYIRNNAQHQILQKLVKQICKPQNKGRKTDFFTKIVFYILFPGEII